MASPFSVFRKYKKSMFAILGIMVMFAFVFLPIIGDSIGTGSGQRNRVVVTTTKFGDLRESNVEDLRHQRQRVLQVLGNLMQTAGVQPNWVEQFLNSTFGAANEESVVDSWLLARHAENMGMVVSDDTVIRFLKGITDDKVKRDVYQTAFKQASITELQFLRAMRDELARLELDQMFGVTLRGITPAQRWDYFKRVKQMAKIEAAAVPVARFVDSVPDPGDEELKAFFEKHKQKYPLPGSPDPGFREPQRVALEYFKAELDQFLKKVTDEEIQQRYDKNKSAYDESEKKVENGTATEESTKDTNDTKEDKGNTPDAGKSGDAKPSETKEPVKADEPAKDTKSKDTSSVSRPSPFRLTALEQEDKSADKKESGKEAEESTKDTKNTKEEKNEKENASDAGKSAEPAAKPAAAKDSPATPAAGGKASETPPATKAGLSEKLKDRIRNEIAYENMQKVFERLHAQMDDYQRQWSVYDVKRIAAESNQKDANKATLPTPPVGLDFDKIAKENGLSAGRTPLVSQWEARGSEIGGSMAVAMQGGKIAGMRGDVYQFAFAGLSKFRPMESIGLKGDLFLFWKTAETKDRIPSFTDEGVRDRVLAAWKLVQARPMALKQAQSLAAEAAKSRKPLKQAFAEQSDLQVVTPPPFSWLTFGSVPLGSAPGAARISEVEGVEAASGDFMRAVFRLDPGSTAAEFNMPKNAAYVIRLIEFTPSEEVLWSQFEVDDFSKYAAVAREDQRQIGRAWIDEIKKSAGFKWERDPDQLGTTSPGEEE